MASTGRWPKISIIESLASRWTLTLSAVSMKAAHRRYSAIWLPFSQSAYLSKEEMHSRSKVKHRWMVASLSLHTWASRKRHSAKRTWHFCSSTWMRLSTKVEFQLCWTVITCMTRTTSSFRCLLKRLKKVRRRIWSWNGVFHTWLNWPSEIRHGQMKTT